MADKGFGSDLWRNVQAVRLGRDGGIEAPVRAGSERGIVLGVDAIDGVGDGSPARRRRLWRRLRRR